MDGRRVAGGTNGTGGTGPLLVGMLSDVVFGLAGIGRALRAVFSLTAAFGTVAAVISTRAWNSKRPR